MQTSNYVEQILNSPVYVFDNIVLEVIAKNLYWAEIELSRPSIEIDAVLFESIKSILRDLKKEEGLLSRFLYRNFGIELRKNKRREQLVYLSINLKSQHAKIQTRMDELSEKKERINKSIVELERLSKGFKAKDMFFKCQSVKNKNTFFINKLKLKVDELASAEMAILMRRDDLIEIEKIYTKFFHSIPRHEHLIEDAELLAGESPKT